MRLSFWCSRTAAAVAAAAAFLAGCASSGPAKPSAAGPGAASSPAWQRPDSIAALGDSITKGFDACSLLADCPKVSWATGTDQQVDSMATRLLPHSTGAAPNRWNLAKTGATMADLPGQVQAAVGRHPAMVTVLMGANDACASTAGGMTSVAGYRADFEKAMRILHRSLPEAQVLVTSIPDLRRLWEVGHSSVLARSIWRLGICPSILARPESLAAADVRRRAAVHDRVKAYNDVLEDVCGQYPICRYDDDAVFDYRFTLAELSRWDWFHPNTSGQAKVAELAYQAAFGD